MNLILGNEIALFAPQIASSRKIADPDSQIGWIVKASRDADGFCGGSLAIRDYYGEQIPLDQNLTGSLRIWPFIEWLSETGMLGRFGISNATQVVMADFEVLASSGVIRNLWLNGMGLSFARDPGWRSQLGTLSSPLTSAFDQYHAGNAQVIHDNGTPFRLLAPYRAGWFAEKRVEPSGQTGAAVLVTDVAGLAISREIYFSSDPNEVPGVQRYITSIDSGTREVGFSPALGYALPAAATLRMVDSDVRAACAEIIADLITYPPNTRDFMKELGKRDLMKRNIRNSTFPIPESAAMKLARYMRR